MKPKQPTTLACVKQDTTLGAVDQDLKIVSKELNHRCNAGEVIIVLARYECFTVCLSAKGNTGWLFTAETFDD